MRSRRRARRRLIGGEGPYQRETRRAAKSRTSQMLPELDARAWCRCEQVVGIHGQASRELSRRRPGKLKPAGFVADGQFQPKCLGSEFSRQIAVDFESNANLHKRGSCPGHSHLPFLSEERQTYSGPFQVARSAGRDMRQLPCGRIAAPILPGVPERVRPMCLSARSLIDESALIAACSMRQAREATTSISRWPSGDLSMFARIFRASQGTRWKSYSYSASISNLRGAGHPAALSAAARRPAFRLPVSIHSPPPRCFSALVSSRRLAPVPPLGSLEMTSVFPCFCPSPY